MLDVRIGFFCYHIASSVHFSHTSKLVVTYFVRNEKKAFRFFPTIGDVLEVSVGVSHVLNCFLGGCDAEIP